MNKKDSIKSIFLLLYIYNTFLLTNLDTIAPILTLNSTIPASVTKGDSYNIIESYTTNNPSRSNVNCSSDLDINKNIINTNQLTITGKHNITCTVTTGAGKNISVTKNITITYQTYTITNLITNGSFEKGLNHWNVYAGTEQSSELISDGYIGNYSLRFNHKDGQEYLAVVYQYLDDSLQYSNHLYYGMEYIKTSLKFTCLDAKLEIYRDTSTTSTLFYQYNNLKVNNWVRISNIIDLPNKENNWHIRTYAQWPNDYVYIDSVVLIDLTATFGSGNEPDKEWCDKHINYFDGTTTIYK